MLASESLPPGLEPLSKAELALLEVECGRLMEQVQAPAQKMPPGADAMFAMLDVAAKLRQSEDRVDCLDIIERDVKVRLAPILEREALQTLEWLTGKLHERLKGGDDLCPSAAPVPGSLDALRDGSAAIDPGEWARAGWEPGGKACLDSDWRERARRFQLEVQTDAAARTSKLIVRGFFVIGAAPSELFVTVTATEHDPEVSPPMRVGGVSKPAE
jgi:hypothetical protein